MKFKKEWLEQRWVANAVALCIAILFFLLVSNIDYVIVGLKAIYHYIRPVVIGVVMAYILDPLAKLLQRKVFFKVSNPLVNRWLSVISTLAIVVFLLALLLASLVPQVIDSVVGFMSNLGRYISQLQDLIGSASIAASDNNVDISGVADTVNRVLQTLSEHVPTNINSIINTSYHITMNVMDFVLAFILAIYFLFDKERMIRGIKRLLHAILPDKAFYQTSGFMMRCHRILVRYISCDILDGLMVGTANFIFMKIAGMPYAILISTVVGITNLAPTFGPILGGVIGAFVLVLVNPWFALWFIIFTCILQLIDGYVVKPKLFGETLGVSSVWILISIIVGGRMFGAVGILIAIPAAAILDFVYKELILVKLEQGKGKGLGLRRKKS